MSIINFNDNILNNNYWMLIDCKRLIMYIFCTIFAAKPICGLIISSPALFSIFKVHIKLVSTVTSTDSVAMNGNIGAYGDML